MSLNASGVRDTARSLPICPHTVLCELKQKETALESVNTALLRTLNPGEVVRDMERTGQAERDEIESILARFVPQAPSVPAARPAWYRATTLGMDTRRRMR